MAKAKAKSETGAQLLARLHTKPPLACLEDVLLPDVTRQKCVYELSGEEGVGKTQLLLHLVVNAILPKSIGGLCVSVIFVDLDYHFSMIRLTSILETRIQVSVSADDDSEYVGSSVEDLVKQCLSRLYVVRCCSSSQFLISLHSLETLLSNNLDICLLMIDSISAFYWIDRSVGGGTVQGHTNSSKLVVEALRKLLNTYNLVVFCAKAELFEHRTQTNNPGERGGYDFMGQHWQRLVTHRWTLSKTRPIRKHASGLLRNCYNVTVHSGSDAEKTRSFVITEKGIEFTK